MGDDLVDTLGLTLKEEAASDSQVIQRGGRPGVRASGRRPAPTRPVSANLSGDGVTRR